MTDRPSSTARGYDRRHQQRRKQAAKLVATGTAICWRCGQPIPPGAPWDLGHDDHNRNITRGPEHQACNRATNSRRPSRNRPTPQHPGLTDQ